MKRSLPDKLALKIYEVLIDLAGASPDDWHRQQFLTAARRGITEYRFKGKLGEGGKLWIGSDARIYVNCYREDETIDRLRMIADTNDRLEEISKELN